MNRVFETIAWHLASLGNTAYDRMDVIAALEKAEGEPLAPLVRRTVQVLAFWPLLVEAAFHCYSHPAAAADAADDCIAALTDLLPRYEGTDDPGAAMVALAFDHAKNAWDAADDKIFGFAFAKLALQTYGTISYDLEGACKVELSAVDQTGLFPVVERKGMLRMARHYMAVEDTPTDLELLRHVLAAAIVERVVILAARAAA